MGINMKRWRIHDNKISLYYVKDKIQYAFTVNGVRHRASCRTSIEAEAATIAIDKYNSCLNADYKNTDSINEKQIFKILSTIESKLDNLNIENKNVESKCTQRTWRHSL